jgi:hypothetical protein
MTVERKMFRSELIEAESSLRVSVIGRVAQFFPSARGDAGGLECWSLGFAITPSLHCSIVSLTQHNNSVPAPFEGSFN